MTYQALARKYRPETFSELIGQGAVSQALSNAVRLGREPSGVIFSGVRGIGKTTSARVFAKALNCEQGQSPEPCNQCYSCKAISGSYHEDVIEIDGASNNSVAEIRSLQETLGYTAQRSLYKIYIIDEVHMLSNSAFNALLKTLEEPPPRVIFIFATTELHKVPKTVISRCQTFYLKRVSAELIAKRLEEILVKESISFDKEVLPIIAQEANGSVRDATTLLDQAIALSGASLTLESIKPLLSSLSNSFLIRYLEALLKKNPQDCLKLVRDAHQQGVDFDGMVESLAACVRHAMILKHLGKEIQEESLAQWSLEERSQLVDLVAQYSDAMLHKLFHHLMHCARDLEDSWLDRFVFENYCVEWCLESPSQESFKQVPVQKAEQAAAATMPAPSFEEKKPLLKTPKETVPLQEEQGFPKSWSLFLERVKAKSPFQGRKLEELSLIEFSKMHIKVAVDPQSFFGEEILKSEAQKKFQELFRSVCDFQGRFEVLDKNRIEESHKEKLSESILDEKERKERELHKTLERETREHPTTLAILKEFDGQIEKTEIHL